MAYTATINLRNGIPITATAFGFDNNLWTFTVASGLNALVAAGGLPTGVTNVHPINGTTSDTVGFIAPHAIRSVTIV